MWIKAKYQVPNHSKQVIVAVLHRYTNGPWQYSICCASFRGGEWWDDINNNVVTPEYWQEMPEPPPVQTENNKELKELAAKLNGLMQNQEPGSFAWRCCLRDTIVELAMFSGESKLIDAAKELK